MRCVSYTRAVSNKPSLSGMQTVSIMEQNDRIQNFAKLHGWKIEKKYSDRKKDTEEETAFLGLKADGIARKYDCVVIDSMYLCGKRAAAAADFILYVLYPAGIQFAVVEDNVASMEMDLGGVNAYLREKSREDSGGHIAVSSTQWSERRKFPKYGYRFGEGCMELMVDEEAAAVVREVFSMALKGYTAKEIAEALDAEGIEPYHLYMSKLWGRDFSHSYDDGRWNESAVARILCNRLYTGEWERSVGGKKVTIPCPPIIGKEIFETVNGDGKPRKKNWTPDSPREPMIFAKKVVDRDTGRYLFRHTRPRNKVQILKFPSPVPVVDYEKKWILYDDVLNQVAAQLARECERAKRAEKLIDTKAATAEMGKRIQPFVREAKTVFEKMLVEENDDEFLQLDGCLNDLEKKTEEVKKAYSRKNPWIKKFSKVDVSQGVTRKIVRDCMIKIECVRFEYVIVEFAEQEWRKWFPLEWFSEDMR